MAGTILTPSAIWNDFNVAQSPKAKIIDTVNEGDVSYSRLYMGALKSEDGQVDIFGLLAKPLNLINCPMLLMINDFECEPDRDLIKAIVSHGCGVLAIDLAGKRDGAEHFTKYPEFLSYANYETAKDNLLSVPKSVIGTCWYVWTCVAKYALNYLQNEEYVTGVGVFGIGKAATVAYQVAGTEPNLKCALFALNAGWAGYRGIYKYAGMVEPQFSDETYKFIAGVEPQTYAGHVRCPALVLAATNSNEFDVDRAYDTVSKMQNAKYKAVCYSINEIDAIDGKAFNSAGVFLDKYLILGGANTEELPAESEIKCELVDCKLKTEVIPEGTNVKSVDLFVSEEISVPSERTWQKVAMKKSGDVYVADYEPYGKSGAVTVFAQVNYKNGFSVGTIIVNKKFNPEEVCIKNKSKILYSSRIDGAEFVFCPAKSYEKVYADDKRRVKVGKGPMGIEGVYSKFGLLTFKFKAVKDMPAEDAILMFDVYSKKAEEFTIKLISDYHGAKIEYLSVVKLVGGEVWQNVKVEMNKFKTVEGMPLKKYEIINALEFSSNSEFLLNNALWV